MAKFKIDLPGYESVHEANTVKDVFILFGLALALWLVVAALLLTVFFLATQWSLGIFGIKISLIQFVAGVVLLGIIRSAISYVSNSRK